MLNVLILATILSPIIVAIMQLVKTSFKVKKNYIPLAALVVGLFLSVAAYPFTDLNITLRLWSGAFAGLASTGLFELGKYREGLTKEGK